MAHAGSHRPAHHVFAGISRTHAQAGCAVRAERSVEGHFLLWFHTSCDCCLRGSFWALWSKRPTGSDDHSDRPAARLFLFVAVCTALVLASLCPDPHPADWSFRGNHRPAGASFRSRRRREEPEPPADHSTHASPP